MTSHELARLLLSLPDGPAVTHAKGQDYHSVHDRGSHGPLQVARVLGQGYYGGAIVIGNMLDYAYAPRPGSPFRDGAEILHSGNVVEWQR